MAAAVPLVATTPAALGTVPVTGRMSVAWDGTDYLAVWPGATNVQAARLHVTGGVPSVTPAGPVLAGTYSSVSGASIAWDGSHFLVVAEVATASATGELVGNVISRDGTRSSADLTFGSGTLGTDRDVAVAGSSTAGSFYVVWQRDDPYLPAKLLGTAVLDSPSGPSVQPPGLLSTDASAYPYDPAVASSGTNFFVVWSGSPEVNLGLSTSIFGMPVTATGTPVAAQGAQISGGSIDPDLALRPSVAWSSTFYLVAWTQEADATAASLAPLIQSRRVSPSGQMLDPCRPATLANHVPGDEDYPTRSSVGWDGANVLVAWNTSQGVSASGVTPVGLPIGTAPYGMDTCQYNEPPTPIVLDANAGVPALASDASLGQAAVVDPDPSLPYASVVSEAAPPLPAVFTGDAASVYFDNVRLGATQASMNGGAALCEAGPVTTTAAEATATRHGPCSVTAPPPAIGFPGTGSPAQETVQGMSVFVITRALSSSAGTIDAGSELGSLSIQMPETVGGYQDLLSASVGRAETTASCAAGGAGPSSGFSSVARLTIVGVTVATRPVGSRVIFNPTGGSTGRVTVSGIPIVINPTGSRVPLAVVTLNYSSYDPSTHTRVSSPVEVEFPEHGPLSSIITGRVFISYARAGCD